MLVVTLLMMGIFTALLLGSATWGDAAEIILILLRVLQGIAVVGEWRQLSSIIAGDPAALIVTWLIHQFGTGYAGSVYIQISAVITLVALKFLKDRSRSDITDERTYSWDADASN